MKYDDTIMVEGVTFGIQSEYDDFMSPPWKEHDGHGDVSEWTHRDKLPGERILSSDGGSHRFYDFAGAIVKAKREGWGGKGGKTKGEIALNAVEADFQYLKDWCDDKWHWISIGVTALDDDGNAISETEWCGGIEDIDDHWKDVADDLAHNILAEMAHEKRESAFAMSLGVPTLA